MWHPANWSAGGEQERLLMRVHKTTRSGAKKQCGFNQGGPFGVRSAVPEAHFLVLAAPTQEPRLSDFVAFLIV